MQRTKNRKRRMPYGSKGVRFHCGCCYDNHNDINLKSKTKSASRKEIKDQLKYMDLINESN